MTSSECSPSTGPSGFLSPPASRTSGFSVNTWRISVGSAQATIDVKPTMRIVKTLPKRRRWRSR